MYSGGLPIPLSSIIYFSFPLSRSTSEYVSAIVELSELVIDRRQKILHHWDWFYWKTEQGKRFRKALSTVHRCDLLTFTEQL